MRGGKVNQSKGKLEDEVDALFRLPLTEFISARKALAARLKKEGHGDQANRVKSLVKPSISAWAVNQLYWKHREAFGRLIATGQDFRRAQSSLLSGKVADLRGPLEVRREVLSELSALATALLGEAGGHNPTPDMIRRITTTLEAMSAYASLPDDLAPGRLTQDVDPPGFDSLASFAPGAIQKRTKEPARVIPFRKNGAATKAQGKAVPSSDARQIEKARQAKIASARALQEASRLLVKARARAQSAEAAQKKAQAEAKQKEKQRREAEERFEKASAASEAAARRAQIAAAEVEEAAKAVKGAEHTLEVASKELEALA
jgi:hypothetical protein